MINNIHSDIGHELFINMTFSDRLNEWKMKFYSIKALVDESCLGDRDSHVTGCKHFTVDNKKINCEISRTKVATSYNL